MGKNCLPPVFCMFRLIGLAAAIAAVTLPAFGRDLDKRYKDSPLRGWFALLANGKGLYTSWTTSAGRSC
jgi:hypothetical protein